MLSREQLAFFETFGFLVVPQAFVHKETAAISQEFDRILERDRRGETFSETKRQVIYGFYEKSPLLMALLDDDRIYEAAGQLLGPGFSWLVSEGNLFVGDTRWHPDGTRLDFAPLKITMYLDPLTSDTGCLRVIPGSHCLPFHEDLKPSPTHDRPRSYDKFGVSGTAVPSFPLETQPGDLIFLNMNLWHAAFGGRPGRRQLSVIFTPEPSTQEHVEIMRRNYEHNIAEIGRYQWSPPGPIIDDALLTSESPRVRGLVSKWIELGLK